ncbi:substrate-binding periplasmic protein [Bdellovibrio sp. HCB274]|uniref:substrate-binding periplasmic protein n=1 Tax=Bdellovibrio sp. HCB274 TaxID=3394361 RepID=UPI0039B56520
MLLLQLITGTLLVFSTLAVGAETIHLNGEDDWAPYSSATKDYKDLQGLAPDIIRAAFKSQGVTVILRPMPFARCMKEVDSGRSLGCFDTLINENTQNLYIFHPTPLFKAEMYIYGPANGAPVTLKDLEGKKVGTTVGYTYPTSFLQNKKILTEDGPTEKSQMQKLAAGRIEYAVLWGLTGERILKNNPELQGKVKSLGKVSRDSLYINFSKKHKDGAKYAAIFETGLKKILENGTYKKIESDFQKNLK